jgi:hypothetical protein
MQHFRYIPVTILLLLCKTSSGQYYNKVISDTVGIESFVALTIIDSSFYAYSSAIPIDQSGYRRRQIVKLDFEGGVIWKKNYFNNSSINYYTAYPSQPSFDGLNLYLIGQTTGSGALMKLDINGDTLWTKEYDYGTNTTFSSMKILDDGELFIAGRTDMGSSQANVIRMDSSGNIKWQYFIGGGGDETVLRADTLSSTRYLISGNKSYIPSGFTDAWMCLLDSAGTVITQKTFGYAYGDGGNATVINADTILFHGTTTSPPNPIAQAHRGFVVLCDANLNFLDTLFVEITPNDYINNVLGSIENTRGEYVLMGNTYDFDIYDPIGQLVCVNKQLDILWYRTYKARENDNYFTDISLMPDGGYIISGYVFSDDPGTTQDGWLVRTNCLGWLSKPVPQFTAFNTGNNTVRFHNYSKFAEKYLWDFGDGWQYTHATSLQDSLSSVPYVEHTYTTSGSYTATLYAIACGDTMTVTQPIVADPVSVTETAKQEIKVYPNPTGGNAFIESPTIANYHTLQVFNDAGQWVYSSSITPNATNRLEIPSSNWANGAYVVVVQGVDFVEKLVLMKTE